MLETVLACLPVAMATAITHTAVLYGGRVDEIRLYKNARIAVVAAGKNILVPSICDSTVMEQTVRCLCGDSLYAHADTIRDGYIYSPHGFRVGVAGRAVCANSRIERITDITSLCIRIPRRHPGCADDVCRLATKDGKTNSILIWSPPGVGKTTVLRELTLLLPAPPNPFRTAVIDTRYELTAGEHAPEFLDILRGYPRAQGMEIAVRTLNPQFVICDEIASHEDAEAVKQCASGGAAVIASAHGGAVEDLHRQSAIHELIADGIFPTLVGLHRVDGQIIHTVSTEGEA